MNNGQPLQKEGIYKLTEISAVIIHLLYFTFFDISLTQRA
jgi:hypothetical protein